MPENRVDDPLTNRLRSGDPSAADPGLSPAECASMRARMLAAGRERGRRPNGWLVPAATAVALLALALGLALRRPQPVAPTQMAKLPRAMLAADTAGSAGHQIQFTTESGILVVWVLQPKPST